MENCQSRLINVKTAVFSLFILGALTLAGCQTIQMPDVSNYDLGLFDHTTITIKRSYNKVNIRPTPSTNQAPIATVTGGDSLQLLAERGNWLNVEFYDTAGNGKNGWIYKYLVEGYEKPVSGSKTTEHHEIPGSPGEADQQPAEEEPKSAPDKDISIL